MAVRERKIQTFSEIGRIGQSRWQRIVVLSVELERKLGRNRGGLNWTGKRAVDCEGF